MLVNTHSTQRIMEFLDRPTGRRWLSLSWEEKKAAWPRLPDPWTLCNCRPESLAKFYSSLEDEDPDESEGEEIPVPPQWGSESWQNYLRWTGALADIEPTDPDWNEVEGDNAGQTTWTQGEDDELKLTPEQEPSSRQDRTHHRHG